MSEYGYIPEAPEQSFGNNKGIFTPKDIYDLTRADKYTNYGQLELIETQTISSTVEYVIFDDIKENEYNVHFMTINGLRKSSNGSTLLTLSNDNATTFETSGYQYAIQRTQTNGSFSGELSSSSSSIRLTNTISTGSGETGNLYCYMYNLGDSTKFSHFTYHTAYSINSTTAFGFAGGVRTTAETINAFRIQTVTADIITNCTISLYGIRTYS
jgi:hypothetical protein